jgi:tetratricopeptide (TPR) repeat protein
MKIRMLFYATILMGIAACVIQGMTLNSARHGSSARQFLKSGNPAAALEKAVTALRFNPLNQHAAYTQCVALKRLARWDDLMAKSEENLEWHPNAPAIHLLAGEGHWQQGHKIQAAQHFRSSLWCRPNPARSAARFWLSALVGSAEEWGVQDPRLAGMALRAVHLAETDPDLTPDGKARMMNQVAGLLEQMERPLTAEAIRQMAE